jgi:hypothetical protein
MTHVRPSRRAHTSARAVTLESAAGLLNADWMGNSDPVVAARLGPSGTAWDEKDAKSEHCTATIADSTSPVWHYRFKYNARADWELHCRVYDSDDFTGNDVIGE